MTEAMQIALIGVAGAILGALLVAFLQPIWANILGKRSHLDVRITHQSFTLPRFLTSQIEQYIYNYRLNIKPTAEAKERLLDIKHSGGTSVVTITNKSKKVIGGVSLRTDMDIDFIADVTVDGTHRDTVFSKVCEIGAISPGSKCTVTLWTRSDKSDMTWRDPRQIIVVTAHEYDKISKRLFIPPYLAGSYLFLSRKIVWRTFLIIVALVNLWGFSGIVTLLGSTK